MKKIFKLAPFLTPLLDLQKLINHTKCKGMIIGGIANNLLAKPRFTTDIDVVILLADEQISEFLKLAYKIGFIPRVKNPIDFALVNRVLLLKHKKSAIDIDISLGLLPFEISALERSRAFKIGKLTFRIPIPEDLIIFKAVAHREKDLIDIKEIIRNNPKIDIKHIRKTVLEFAKVLEMPEIWSDIKAFFHP